MISVRALVALLLFVAGSAHAALFDDNEARQRISDTNARLSQVQRQLEERLSALESQLKSQGLVDLFNQVEQIRSEVARLRGQVEVLTYELEQAQKRQRDLYVDLDTRVRKLESGAQAAGEAPPSNPTPPVAGNVPPVASAPPSPPPAPSDPVAEQRAYDAALDRFKRGDYAGAITGFATFVKNYPQSPLAPSAQY